MEWQLALFLATAAALVLPKVYGLVAAVVHRPARRGFGGICRLAMSAAVETVMAVLVAPVMMLYHARFVIETLTGIKVQWNAQSRDEQATDWGMLLAEHLQHLVAGILLFAVAWTMAPWLLWWLSPVWLPLLVAVPVAAALGSAQVGLRMRRAGLLLIPEERTPSPLLIRKQVLVADGTYALREWDERDGLALAIVDPRLNHLHSQVQESTQDKPWHADRDLVARVERDGVAGLGRGERAALLRDPDAMRRLHRAAWSTWPRERLEAALGGPLPATG
jgi:membrane glycosyltransferase